jgi:hypothetical protein
MDLVDRINCQIGGVVYVDYGQYIIDRPVNARCSVVVEGGADIVVGAPVSMLPGSSWSSIGSRHNLIKQGGSNLFTVKGDGVRLSGFETDEHLSTGGYTVMLDTAQHIQKFRFKDVRTHHSLGLIADNSNPSGMIIDLEMDDVMARLLRGRASYLTRAFAYIFLRKCTADYIGNLAEVGVPAWSFFNVEGLHLDHVDVTGTAATGGKSEQHGFWFQGCRAVVLGHTMADSVGGRGHAFVGCHYIESQNMKSSLVGGFGLTVQGSTTDLRMDKVYLSGRNGLPAPTTQALIWTDGTNQNLYGADVLTERCAVINSGYSAQEIAWGRGFNR